MLTRIYCLHDASQWTRLLVVEFRKCFTCKRVQFAFLSVMSDLPVPFPVVF